LYRASVDSFSTTVFHQKCDNKGPTITIIKTTDGDVFGGYNSQSWNSNGQFYGDNKSFIFTLVSQHGIPPSKYIPNKNSIHFVVSAQDTGPIFGSSFGLEIKISYSNKNFRSYQNFPSTYIDTTGKGKAIHTYRLRSISSGAN